MAESILKTILEASFTAGIAAMIVILLRFPMKKLPKRWSYILWAVVFFRCLCPFSVESTVSLFNAVNAVPEQNISIQEDIPEAAESNVPVQADYSDTAETENSPAAGTPENHIYFPDPSDSPYIDHSGNADLSKANVNPLPAPEAFTASSIAEEISPEISVEETEEPSEPVSRSGILFPVWAAGTAAILLYSVISYGRLMRKVKFSVKAEDGVYETDLIPTAFSAGFFPPKIYLPCGLSQKERELIITHERVHIKRLDFIAKPLAFAGLAIHWFNPLIWAAFILMTRDMELSCDEAVLKILGAEEKKEYSRALLRVSMKHSGLAALPIAFAGTGIKERVKNVLSYKKPRIIATVISAAIVLTACAVLGTNGVSYKEAGNYDEASLTLIEDDSGEKDQMIEIENSSGDRIILLNSEDRSYHENAGLNAALIETEGQMLIFTGNGIDIDIDPEYIARTVITDLQIKHYDDYDGDGETDDLTFVAIDMEFQMTDDYVMPHSVVNGDKGHGTVMSGGNNQLFSIYAEIEIDRNELEKFPDYCPGIMLTGFRSGIKNDGRWMFGTEIYVTDNLKITDMSLGRTIDEESDQAEEARKREDEEFMLRYEEEDQDRLRAEQEQLKAERSRLAELFQDDLPLLNYPLEGYHIVSEQYNGEERISGVIQHKGIDFSVSQGEPVFASADGTVTEASSGWSNGYGNMAMIDHGSGLSTLYAHLNYLFAEEGDSVTAGQLIGYSGSTGDAVDNTLHFEVRLEDQCVDPMLFLKQDDSGSSENTASGEAAPERFHEMYIKTETEEEIVIRLDEADPNIVYPVGNISDVNREYTPFARSADRSIRRTVTFYVPEGTPVYSCMDGIVEAAEETKNGRDSVKIGHSYSLSFTYSNLSKRLVNVGDKIKKGDLIGYSGHDYTSSSMFYSSYLSVMVKVGGENSDRIYKAFQNAVDGGSEDFLPMVVYNGMFYIIDEEIKGKAGDRYRFSHTDPIAEVQEQKFELEITDELYSNFMPVLSRIYKYEGGAKVYDAGGDPVPAKDDDDLAIVVVYDLNGEHVVIFRPLQDPET